MVVYMVLALSTALVMPGLVSGEEFLIGYLTGSQRLPGDLEYPRPGLTISGAISLAVDEINVGPLGQMGHSLRFLVAETFGEEGVSIKETASLWTRNVSVYLGPQETCVHEGRMAAAFNLPMISYFCTHSETSDKKDFPTFARTRPPDTQISKSVAALLLAFNWTHVSFLHQKSEDEEFGAVSATVLVALRAAGVFVRHVRSWNGAYHHGYMNNPFHALLQDTYRDTRIYVILGHYYEHLGLMLALDELHLCDTGEYWVVGVDIEQYDANNPDKYLRGLLQDDVDPKTARAFSCYLGVTPTAPRGTEEFARLVNHYLELPPFSYPNPLLHFGGAKTIRAEAAYLYDAVHLYARALIEVLRTGNDPRNGSAIIEYVKGTHYNSAMGYMVYMDENGDAAGNYSLVGLEHAQGKDESVVNVTGLYPVGLFVLGEGDTGLPELLLSREISWGVNGPPIAEPLCGFRGEKCINYSGEIGGGIAGGVVLVVVVVALVLYRNWRYEQELDSLLWKVDYKEIQINDEKQGNGSAGGAGAVATVTPVKEGDQQSPGDKPTRAIHPFIRTSQVSLSSNPDADFRYSAIYTQVGLYRGRLLAIKKVRKKSIDISRDMKKELKMMRDLRHDNLNAFIGACTESPNICIVTEYCTRGSLKDILENEDVKLDNMFIASLVGDIVRGMIYLHESAIRFHGALNSSNCLVDSRWVVKLADFGLHLFKNGQEPSPNIQEKCQGLLYRAPELLRADQPYAEFGTQKGDVYSFSIILYELHTRRGPFGETELSTTEILRKIIHPEKAYFRPPLEPLESSFDFVRDCLKECWAESPEDRPDFKSVRTKLRPLRKGMKSNIFDNMMSMMEKYANNLEALVDERTDQLQEEKKKTEALLFEMLPRPVAEQLKRGNKVEAESFDCVTIYFSDIVGFTSMSAQSTPLQVVDFLNELYTCFDSCIEHYDVYKVETIGDAYMVVSGLPLRNGFLHAGEVASMSLDLLHSVRKFSIRHRPDDQLMLRIGIHSGPVCAGVVGLKMPRYCLFGDTVNTASRMESTGLPLKIHCSSDTKHLLDQLGGYEFAERGMVAMKGKGEQVTYFLTGEDDLKRAERTAERSVRRGLTSKANENGLTIPRSSLKNKSNLPRSPLPRCSSLESPKKLRFASGHLLEFHQYQHYTPKSASVLEAIVDYSPCKKSSNSHLDSSGDNNTELFRVSSSSCPCIERLVYNSINMARMQLKLLPKCTFNASNSSSTPNLCTDDDVTVVGDVRASAPTSPCIKNVPFNGFNIENEFYSDHSTPLLINVFNNNSDVETRV